MALLDLLGRRWVLRILWELRDGDSVNFRQLQSRCDSMSPSVLSQRLTELRDAGIVEMRTGDGYRLTEEGSSLIYSLAPLSDWARRWAKRARPKNSRAAAKPSASPAVKP
jgi:DNA-binding HxlR family transcriptional regulator